MAQDCCALQHDERAELSSFWQSVSHAAATQVELVEVLDFFSKSELFRASGAVIPRGVLLCGSPGTDKIIAHLQYQQDHCTPSASS